MEQQFDLIVIGAGPGGYEAALKAAALGAKTALVERREIGGTCLNRGCVPTKTLLHAAQLFQEMKHGAEIDVNAGAVTADLPAMYARKDAVVSTLRTGIEGLLKRAKVDVLRGSGTILGSGLVRVDGAAAGEYSCKYILAATGAAPARPPIPGLELALSSDELLSGQEKLPQSLVIIGGGVIGVEFATFYNDLGCAVTVLEGLDRLLPNMERELGQGLAATLKKRGVGVQTKAMVQSLERTETGIRVHYLQKDKPAFAEGETVLCAIGRRPEWTGLFAEGLNPETEGRRLRVDAQFRTSIPGVYAIGDLSSAVQLAHVATAQGIACVETLFGAGSGTDLTLIPGCVYTRPEIASVGLTEAEAQEKGIKVRTAKALMGGNARTLIVSGGRGFVKLVAEAESGRLLGAQLMCERATDLIGELAAAIANRLTAADLLKPIRPHPTFTEAIRPALEGLCK